MKIKTWVLIPFICLVMAGIGSLTMDMPPKSPEHANAMAAERTQADRPSVVPDEILHRIKNHFPAETQEHITKDNITMLQVNLKDRPEGSSSFVPQLAVSVALDHLNGLFAIYEQVEGGYKEVYVLEEPVYGVQVLGGGVQQIAFTSGLGGTGVQENKLHVIRHTPEGYAEVWSDIAHSHEAREMIQSVDGTIVYDEQRNELIYFQLKRTMDAAGTILAEKSSYQVLVYNEKTRKYELVG
ncbi:hypothetical protein [Brevibacillus dissolubilis]|uniref:hypothetical protein n=1 Tax=Brevibacillus dissolubilis TaxID=1844116 RepID=UPI0011174FF4|nr:hypothetical protein [Brevibacillus dissolubilis]